MTLSSQLRALALIALLGALVFGCGSDPDAPGTSGVAPRGSSPAPAALDVTYVVVGVTEAGKRRPLVAGSEIRLAFGDGQLRITAGCNSMGGGYRLDGTRLSVESLASTEMGCEQALMDQDTWVAGLFAAPVRLTTGNDAALISGDVVLTLEDRRTARRDSRLLGTAWVLDSIGSGRPEGSVSSVPDGVVAYARFSPGEVTAYDGCNGGWGPAEVSAETIAFGDRVTDLRGCTDDRVGTVVAAFHEVLAGTARWAVTENRLTLTRGDLVLGFRAESRLPDHD